MLIVKVKSIEEISPFVTGRVIAVCCEGCRDVYYPDNDVIAMLDGIAVRGTDFEVLELLYMCSENFLDLYMQNYKDLFISCDTILTVSCGVGVQMFSNFVRNVSDSKIISCCDTLEMPGFQGLTPSKFNCALCGDCHLNETGAICPITSCKKSLVNGQCGGAKNGMCEVDDSIECGWERIYQRLEKYYVLAP